MATRGGHEALSKAPPPSSEHGAAGEAAGFAVGRTLSLRVEARRQWGRRRTQLALGFVVLLPFLLVAAFTLGSADRRNGAPGLVDLATTGATNFTLFTLFVSSGFLIVVIVAMFAGDTVASEASWSSLRYLLALPVPRSRLLRQKLLVALGFAAATLVLLPLVAFLAGGVFFGWAPGKSPLGITMSVPESIGRLAIIVAYIAVTMLFVAALAFLLGVWTDAPLGAVGGAVLLVVVSNILDQVTALGSLREALPTHYGYAWIDALGPAILWDDMIKGSLWSIGYSIVLLGAAWIHFLRKDIVS